MSAEYDTARREVRSLPVRRLAELPEGSTVALDVFGFGPAWLTTSRARAASPHGEPTLTPLEYEALARALADGLTRAEARAALASRASGRRVTLEGLLGPARRPDAAPEPWGGTLAAQWTVGTFVDALGARIVGVTVEGRRE